MTRGERGEQEAKIKKTSKRELTRPGIASKKMLLPYDTPLCPLQSMSQWAGVPVFFDLSFYIYFNLFYTINVCIGANRMLC